MRVRVFAYFILIVSLFSCNENMVSVFSIDGNEVTSQESDSLTIYVDGLQSPISFKGNLDLIDGQCELILYSPIYDTVYGEQDTTVSRRIAYNEIFTASDDVTFNEEFEAILGEWEFFYYIDEYQDVDPYVNFEFTFQYTD